MASAPNEKDLQALLRLLTSTRKLPILQAMNQPRVRILGREVAVLKRGGYTWRGDEEERAAAGGVEDAEGGAANDGDNETRHNHTDTHARPASSSNNSSSNPPQAPSSPLPTSAPGTWSVSQTLVLKDSTFVARATTLNDPAQRATLVRNLLDAHPNLRTASHNAWAYRVRSRSSGGHDNPVVRQDSFDDGETGCGDLLLRVMRELGAVDTLVVLTRWFGGTMLGPDRWRLMRNCVTGALAERLRRTGAAVALSGEAAWGLDLEGARQQQQQQQQQTSRGGPSSSLNTHTSSLTGSVGMPIHRPESARQYLLKSFATWDGPDDGGPGATTTAAAAAAAKKKKKTIKAMDAEKADNLGRLLGALRLLYDSWADHVPAAELDRRAWSWYVAVRPDVDVGPSGWGAKGAVKLQDILDLRRPPT
ncbi:Impact family [Niveomyces insectorum RCEF 264]|uniref:Impact family n=1 Tax=Niveomyces insectorum RCEF 264 TaxID=1081102 RepID=A0A167ZVM7_9HYPO|nr:Impact family [Niveomyces insectorum RCEF 264]